MPQREGGGSVVASEQGAPPLAVTELGAPQHLRATQERVVGMWIAAGAMEHGLMLYTRDARFAYIDGLLTASTADGLLP